MLLGPLEPGQNAFYTNPIGGFHDLAPEVVFVFGSNLRGRHGKGAALTAALKYAFPEGKGEGYEGRCYAIPTKDRNIRTLPLSMVDISVQRFVAFTRANPHLTYFVTPVGTGLAQFTNRQMAPLFKGAVSCYFPHEWMSAIKS